MLKVYYTIDIETECIDANADLHEFTGNKTVNVYTVERGEVEKFFDLELLNSENTEEMINDWLEDNGYSEKNIKLIQL